MALRRRTYGLYGFILCIICGMTFSYYSQVRPMIEKRHAYARGEQAARQDWNSGNARICGVTPGKALPDYKRFDPETGLTVFVIGGCLSGDDDVQYCNGYNDTIRSLIVSSGIPANSRLHWKTAILQPQSYMQEPSTNSLIQLSSQKEPVPSPDRLYSIQLHTGSKADQPDAEAGVLLSITITAPDGKMHSRGFPYNADRIRFPVSLKWGPTGSDILFCEVTCEKDVVVKKYVVFDLRDGTPLNCVFRPE